MGAEGGGAHTDEEEDVNFNEIMKKQRKEAKKDDRKINTNKNRNSIQKPTPLESYAHDSKRSRESSLESNSRTGHGRNNQRRSSFQGKWSESDKRHHINSSSRDRPHTSADVSQGGARSKERPDADGFVLVQHRRPTTGRRSSPTPGLSGAPPPTKPIFVHRIQDGDTQLVKEYIEKNNVKVSNIKKMSHEQSKFSSYKVYIFKHDLSKVLDDYFWPMGVQCKVWWNRPIRDGNKIDDTDKEQSSVNKFSSKPLETV